MATKGIEMSRRLITRLAEINSGSAVEPAAGRVRGLDRGRNGRQGGAHIRAWSDLEHLYLALVTRPTRRVAQAHVVSQGMHSAALDGCKV